MSNARNQKLDRGFPSSAPKMDRVAQVEKKIVKGVVVVKGELTRKKAPRIRGNTISQSHREELMWPCELQQSGKG